MSATVAPLEQVADHELPAGRRGGAQEEAEEFVGRGGSVELRPRLVALVPGLARRPDDGGGTGDERCRRERPGRDADAMPTHELGRAISERVGPGGDRLVNEIAPDVGRERFHGRVALGRILLESLCGDGVEISAELPAQAVPSRRPRRSVGVRRRVGGPLRIGVHDRLEQEHGRSARRARRVLAGEHQVEERAEGVDVGRGGDSASGQLFRRRELRRHGAAAFPRQGRGLAGARFLFDEFRDLDFAKIFEKMHKPAWIFDGRNVLDMAKLRSLGFYVYSIGKPESI